jgi:hypothetical protein
MDAHSTLIGIIAHEASKLDTLSKADAEPLTPDHMEALEVLCRCTKQLRAPTREPEPEGEAPSVEDDLKAVGG